MKTLDVIADDHMCLHFSLAGSYRIRSKNSSPFVHQNNSSFEAIRARMKKTIECDEHLDFSDEILEQR